MLNLIPKILLVHVLKGKKKVFQFKCLLSIVFKYAENYVFVRTCAHMRRALEIFFFLFNGEMNDSERKFFSKQGIFPNFLVQLGLLNLDIS